MTVVPSKPGNVFYTTDSVTIPVQATQGTTVGYQVFNYWGTQTYSGKHHRQRRCRQHYAE